MKLSKKENFQFEFTASLNIWKISTIQITAT